MGSETTNGDVAADEGLHGGNIVALEKWRIKPHVEVKVLVLVSFKTEHY